MEENLPWKIVFLAVIFSLAVLGIAYYLISPRESAYFEPEKIERIAEFKNTRIEYRKEGKLIWEFYAQNGWTSKDRETTYLFDVSHGRIYQNGKLAIYDLSAPQVKVASRNEIVEASGRLRAYIDMEKLSPQPKNEIQWTRLQANYAKITPSAKISEISGNITLSKKNTLIRADNIIIDHDKKTAAVSGRVQIRRKDAALTADSAHYFGETGQINAFSRIHLDLTSKRIRTFVKCNQASFNDNPEKDINLNGSLEVTQGKKLAIASEGIYSKSEQGLTLKGNTRTIIEKARAILKEETVKKLNSPDVNIMLKEKTVVSADQVFFSTKTGDARSTGNVVVTQKGREAHSDSAVYDDKNEVMVLRGNV